ncbi:group III truncated hemoglobin [Curvivirga sp.]|uniref:group III truncated hemoglobin n=1 Tax=Curvivirga sp. TaxID=2856848 RepID=UPI003B59CECF
MTTTKMNHTEINDQTIKILVDHFYSKILEDELVGPLFKRHIGDTLDQWGDHLLTMYRFWASVMNGTGQYKGSPHMVHSRFAHEAETEFFQRWLNLWFESCDETFVPDEADKFKKKAEMIAKSLHYTMFDDKMPEDYIPQPKSAA